MSTVLVILSIILFITALKNIRAFGYVGIPLMASLIATQASAAMGGS